ncbi:hypothetical protein GC177_03900 [bacterium]|nr:hypothetical protein [bacterium]
MNWFRKKTAESSADPAIPADTLLQLCQQMGGICVPLHNPASPQRMQYNGPHGLDVASVENWLSRRLESHGNPEHYLTYPQLLHGNNGLYHTSLLHMQDGWKMLCFPTARTGTEKSLVARLRQGAWGQLHHDMLDSLNAISLCAEWVASGKWVYNTGEAIASIRRAARQMEHHLRQMADLPFSTAESPEANEPFLLEAGLNQLGAEARHGLAALPESLWLFLPASPFQKLLEMLLHHSGAQSVDWQWQLENGLTATFSAADTAWLHDMASLLDHGRLNARRSDNDHTELLNTLCPLAEYGVRLAMVDAGCSLTIPSRYVMAVPHIAAQPEAALAG